MGWCRGVRPGAGTDAPGRVGRWGRTWDVGSEAGPRRGRALSVGCAVAAPCPAPGSRLVEGQAGGGSAGEQLRARVSRWRDAPLGRRGCDQRARGGRRRGWSGPAEGPAEGPRGGGRPAPVQASGLRMAGVAAEAGGGRRGEELRGPPSPPESGRLTPKGLLAPGSRSGACPARRGGREAADEAEDSVRLGWCLGHSPPREYYSSLPETRGHCFITFCGGCGPAWRD